MSNGNEIQTFEPRSIEEAQKLCAMLARSPLMPDALRGKEGDIFVIIATGRELGLPMMQSIRAISIIKGKPSLSADLMVALCKKQRDVCESLVLVESTAQVATYKAKRVGEPETVMSFTMQDAQAAGLASSDMYKRYPKQMLRARCASLVCRAVFPDLCMGLYDSDSGELSDPIVPAPTVAASSDKPPKLERATEDAATEPAPPPGLALPSGPPEPKTEAFDRWFESEIEKAATLKELQQLARTSKGKVKERERLNLVFLKKQGELNRAGAH